MLCILPAHVGSFQARFFSSVLERDIVNLHYFGITPYIDWKNDGAGKNKFMMHIEALGLKSRPGPPLSQPCAISASHVRESQAPSGIN